jgi:predicted RNA-binding protein with PIN domain
MSQIILDGYNVIHKIPQLKHNLENSLENARTSLANFVMTWTKTHTHKGSIAIVFDGRDGIINSSQSICGTKCIFTKTKQEADDRIISMVRNHPNSKEIIVISDDNYVTNNCKAHGAQVRPADFLTQPKSQVSIQDGKHIDSKTEQEITNWLKKQYGM